MKDRGERLVPFDFYLGDELMYRIEVNLRRESRYSDNNIIRAIYENYTRVSPLIK